MYRGSKRMRGKIKGLTLGEGKTCVWKRREKGMDVWERDYFGDGKG